MRWFLRVVLAIVLIAVIVGAGAFIYNAGVSMGMTVHPQLNSPNGAAPNGGVVTPPYYYGPFFRPWGFGFGFFPFGFLIPILFFLLFFLLIRGLFFRGHYGWGRVRDGGWYGGPGGVDGDQVPPVVEQWHRKMHENPSEPVAKPEENQK